MALLVAVSVVAPAVPGRPPPLLIEGVPHIQQEPDFCGEACVAMYLAKLGVKVGQRDVFDRTGLDPRLGRGAFTADLVEAVRRIGFRPGPVWFRIAPKRADRELAVAFEALVADLRRGVPSVVCMHYDARPGTTEHFRLVLGYDQATDEVIYHEPALASSAGAYRRMPRARFLALWPLKYEDDAWTLIRIVLDPGRIDVVAPAGGATPAAHAQHMMQARRRIPAGFTTEIVGPFLVIGDEAPARVKHHAGVVRWTINLLKQDFRMREPDEIIDIWLFGSDESYLEHALRLFKERPSTPYGFYSPEHKALFMNIGTGGGTLVHEVVHPFIRKSFPGCPAWFNEGLASLYERVEERDGHLRGLPNWRLAGLKRAIRAGKLPTFATLTSHTERQFYDSVTGYAHARYLCLFLQERGLLRRYYAEYLDARATDPTGYRTLGRVLGTRDLRQFQRGWEAWVLDLEEDG
jgi:hypothetical protein